MGEMPGRIPRLVWLALPLAYLLYFYHLDAAGLLSSDEPRYASVGREMARSGDWVTPRLWGEPWFEKPALLYWMTATGFRLGLGPELAPRLPVALVALVFLGFYWRILWREFGCAPAGVATLILGTCWGWVGFSQIGVTDLVLTATFSAAMLLALPWIAKGDTRPLPAVAAMFGLAVLAKGLVPLVLALPLALPLVARGPTEPHGRFRDLLQWRVVLSFLAVTLPWYLLCYLRNGSEFLKVFFWEHHFGRFFSGELLHVQSVWFYLPVLAGGLLPWLPLAGLLARRDAWRDPRRLFLLVWVLWGLIFFSLSTNKLPGYILPLVPAVAALMGWVVHEAEDARPWLAASAALLISFPIAAQVLPAAVASGLSRAPRPHFEWTWLLPVVAAAAVWMLRARRVAAVSVVAACATAGVVYLKQVTVPEVDHAASARGLWRKVEARADHTCVTDIQRNWRYGLNYYSVTPLPDCATTPRPLEIRQDAGQPAYLAPASSGRYRDAQLRIPDSAASTIP